MDLIVAIFIALAVVGIGIEILRRSRQAQAKKNSAVESLGKMERFDEAAPTQTGLFRVREILGTSDGPAKGKSSTLTESADSVEGEEESLPDPFERN